MASPRRFANHPGAKEAPASALEFCPEKDKNPALRGLPLVIASAIFRSSSWIQKFFWENAKFGSLKYIRDLDDVQWRIKPDVIPLGDGTTTTSNGMIELGPELQIPQPTGLPGRFYAVADYHELYKSGEVTPLQVAEALLPLIRRDAAQQQPQSKYAVAWTQCKPEEVLAAARASTERWAAGKPLGVLDGVPFGVKDDIDVKGFVSTMGMKVDKSQPYFNKPKTETAWPVRKLEEAGAIMMGKMNQHEVGMDTTGCNPATGIATNWYNKSYYPGGSSSGAGSALSGGLVPIAVGTDAGGSIRIPPSFCGVYGLKTTHNRTMSTSSSVCIIGPMAATVADLTIAYRLMAQPNPDDPAQNLLAPSIPPSPSSSSLKKPLGVCREWVAVADPEVLSVFDQALAYLTTQLNYTVVDIKLPFLREGQIAHAATCLTESASDARSRTTDPSRFLSLLNHPNRILVGTGAQTPAADYLRYGQIRQVIMSHLAWLFEQHRQRGRGDGADSDSGPGSGEGGAGAGTGAAGSEGGLLVLTPTTPVAGWPIRRGDEKYGCSDGNMSIRSMTFVWYANMSGCPAVTCPAGYVEPAQGRGKLPVGLMAMGEWGCEEQLLAFARDVERYLNEAYPGGRQRPEEWADVIGLAREAKGK